jgi:lysozyme
MKTGADISHYQASFHVAAYEAAGEDFIALKATEGHTITDPVFTDRWRAAAGAGLPRVAYHFGYPGGSSTTQADHFVAAVRRAGWRRGCAWALDVEVTDGTSGSHVLAWADAWCRRVRAALGGAGLFYSFPYFVIHTLGNPGRIPGGCLGWWAEYDAHPYTTQYGRPRGWPDPPHCWQHTDAARVAGIGTCDHNRMTDGAFAELFQGEGKEADVPYREWPQADKDALLNDISNKVVEPIYRLLARGEYENGTVDRSSVHYQTSVQGVRDKMDEVYRLAARGEYADGTIDPASVHYADSVRGAKEAILDALAPPPTT